jgi:hypothetical protein
LKRVLAVAVLVVVVGVAIVFFARRSETPTTEATGAPAPAEQAAAPSEQAEMEAPPTPALEQTEAQAEAAKPAEEAETKAEAEKPAEQAETAGAAPAPAATEEGPAASQTPAAETPAATEPGPAGAPAGETAATAATAAAKAGAAAEAGAAETAGAAEPAEGAQAPAAGEQQTAARTPREALRPGEEPDWPCPQRYVAELSPGAIWTGPAIDEALKTWQNDAAVRDLVVELSSDTIEEKDGVQMIDDFAAKAGPDKDKMLTEVFAGIFDSLNSQRSSMLRGVKRFVKRQETVVQKINDLQEQERDLEAKGVAKDDPKIGDLEKQIYWNTRVYDERTKLTPYICDEPILLETRLGTFARALEAHLSQ